MSRFRLVALLGLIFAAVQPQIARAQVPPLQPAPAPAYTPQLPPLLHVKVIGPQGMQATFYRGAAKPQTFDVPFTIGLRPGFRYRMAITNVPNFPNQVFFPTLELRGTLLLGNKLRNADFPAPLVFTNEEFARASADAIVKKVIVLERPENAVPLRTRADEPIEVHLSPNRDPLLEAHERGQPLLVMHMGQRQMTPQDLVNLPGTLLLPGEKVLSLPPYAPWLPWQCYPVIDPTAGPRPPSEDMLIPDGGDVGLPAGFQRGKLKGLDPTDTVAEYVDSKGRQRLAVSNRVGLCIPRFVVLRGDITLAGQMARVGPGSTRSTSTFADMSARRSPLESSQNQLLEGIGGRIKAGGTVQTIGLAISGRINGLVVVGTQRGTMTLDGTCIRPEAPEAPDGPLVIIKWPDRWGALVGDIITFTLRYTNSGGQPITNIVVSDSLATRFEYVPGSARADRESIFTTQPNDAGSQVLRWEIPGALLPRENGTITFQVRVR